MKIKKPEIPPILSPYPGEDGTKLEWHREEELDVEEMCIENLCLDGEDLSRLSFYRTVLRNCRFTGCNMEKTAFVDVRFENCDFSNCSFTESYFHRFEMSGGKCLGGNFTRSVWKQAAVQQGNFRMANFDGARMEGICMVETDLECANITHCRLRDTEFYQVNFQQVSFFFTPLKGIDFTQSEIKGIAISDQFAELRGAVINPVQAAELVKLLGVSVQ